MENTIVIFIACSLRHLPRKQLIVTWMDSKINFEHLRFQSSPQENLMAAFSVHTENIMLIARVCNNTDKIRILTKIVRSAPV